jgi:hypothetical protein
MVASLRSESVTLDSNSAVAIAVTYDPTLLPGKQFVFATGNLCQISGTTDFTVTVAGANGLTVKFNGSPINFTTPPDLTAPVPTRIDDQTITFTLTPPPHYFVPWSFSLSVDATVNGVDRHGIISPIFFVSLPPEDVKTDETPNAQTIALIYNANTGSFNLDNAVQLLGGTLVLFNTAYPLDVTVQLSGADQFFNLPMSFTGGQPAWMTTPLLTGNNGNKELTFTISDDHSMGLSTGFHFAVVSGGLAINSPDPILVNATLGDGG